MEKNMIVIRDPKAFCFNFDWPRYAKKNSKHEIEFIMKSNGYFFKNEMKNGFEELLLKYKHRNNIHEHRKQQIE